VNQMDWFSQSFSEVVRNWAFVAGGAFGLYLAWKRVTAANMQADAQIRQAELARRTHVAELFNRAIGQLKDRKLEVRLGAIFTLHQICKDFPDLSGPVIRLLTTYLQENRVNYRDQKPPIDVKTILGILGERTEDRK
jgi:hypothetical protein